MKKLKMLAIAIMTFVMMTMSVQASENACTISSGDFTNNAVQGDCRIVEISGEVTIQENEVVTINNKIVILDSNATLTVKGTLNIKDFVPAAGDLDKVNEVRGSSYTKLDTTNVIFESGSKLVIEGSVVSSNGADESCSGVAEGSTESCPIAFQTKKGETSGEIKIDGGSLTIDGFKRGGIAVISKIDVTNNGTMKFTNNGYGSNTAPITLDSGKIIATGNDVGFTAKLTARGDSSVEATKNKIIGVVLNDSTIEGNTTLNITGNNTSGNSNRGTDLAINANNGVTVQGNADVTVGKVRTYFKDDAKTPALGTNNSLKLNGEGASLSYTEVVQDESVSNKQAKIEATTGVEKTGNEIKVHGTVTGDINVKKGETLTVLEGADVSGATITAEAGASVKNESQTSVTVNGHEVSKETSYTVPTPSRPSSNSYAERDTTITDGVTFKDTNNGLVIEGSIIKDKDDTYKNMIQYAEKQGYKNLFNMYEFHIVEGSLDSGEKVRLTFDLGEENNGKTAYVLHQKHDGSYEFWKQEVKDGKISINVYEFSPFIVMLKNTGDSGLPENPKTLDNIVYYIAIAAISTPILIYGIKKYVF